MHGVAGRIQACEFALSGSDLLHARVSGYYFEPHLHSTFAIGVLRRGHVVSESRSGRSVADDGDVFLFHPFEVHGGGNRAEPIHYHVLYPSVRFVRDCLELSGKSNDSPVFEVTLYRNSTATCELLDALECADCKSSRSVEIALQSFLRSASTISRAVPAIANRVVQGACELISEHFRNALRTDDLASSAGLSEGHFIRLFRDITGLTPQSYLRQVRVAHARESICAGDDLADVAVETGFVDQAHMTHAFKSIYGFTPGQLSRNVRAHRAHYE
jgi:AraC-like DNA-binding protein